MSPREIENHDETRESRSSDVHPEESEWGCERGHERGHERARALMVGGALTVCQI